MHLNNLKYNYILIDTSALVSIIDENDTNHEIAKIAYSEIKKKLKIFICSFTIHETYTRLRYNSGYSKALALFTWLMENLNVEKINWEEQFDLGAKDIIENHRGLKLSFHDALCAFCMLENQIGRIFSFDDDFFNMGFLCSPNQPI